MALSKNRIVAHRGAFKKKNLPENSVAALKEALQMNYAGTEFDVQMTKDEILVINHDSDFHHLEIEKSTYQELSDFKLKNGESLPKLNDFLRIASEINPFQKLFIEIKPSVSKDRNERMTDLVLETSLFAQNKICYISFDYDVLKRILSKNSNADTQYLNGDKTPRELCEDGILGMNYHYKKFRQKPEWIEQSKNLGLQLNTWTVNHPKTMLWFLEKNFDFITTNQPELLNQIETEHSKIQNL